MPIRFIEDLSGTFGQARDQGMRPTCLAFATSDCHAAKLSSWSALSCEYLYYWAQTRSGKSATAGATLPAILEALLKDGQPIEGDWPYLTATPTNLATWVPPKTIGAIFRRKNSAPVADFDEIVSAITKHEPVLLVLMLCDGFYQPDSGVVVAGPSDKPDPARKHAVVAVAYGMVDEEPAILVRNSWGTTWGLQGYAWLPKSYLAPRLTDMILLTESPDVPTH